MESKADLQIHSRYSNKPPGYVLRRIGVPESYSKPSDLYDKLRLAGMDFVTITDHNKIEGCLEIADRPGTFISEEATTYFPDGTKIHLLIWDITPAQHEVIHAARENIFDLASYLREHAIAHAVSHPLMSVDDRYSLAHFEQLILLFRTFEGLNGTRDDMASHAASEILSGLTPEVIAQLEEVHGFKSPLTEPWRKSLTGGSDDHAGLSPARAYTVTPPAATAREFLGHVMEGRSRAEGQAGSSMNLSHSLYATGYHFYEERIARSTKSAASTSKLVGRMFTKFLKGKNPTSFTLGEKMEIGFDMIASKITGARTSAYEVSMAGELAEIFGRRDFQRSLEEAIASEDLVERKAFQVATHLTNQMGFIFFKKFIDRVNEGSFLDSWQSLTAIAPLAALVAPYLISIRDQHKDRPLKAAAARRFLKTPPPYLQNTKRAWVTDTIEDVNGVATTIRTMVKQSVAQGCDLTVITSRGELAFEDIPLKNFPPVGEFEIPEYELQRLSFPPILNIADYCEQQRFTELIISTPGPVGVSALLAAKLLGLKTSGIYHTDFPQYVKILSEDDDMMETLCWQYMYWFYDQMDVIWVNSSHYRDLWVKRGIRAEKIKILPRGIDMVSFHPSKREEGFWTRFGIHGGTVFLYVGRVSKEKNIEIALEAFRRVRAQHPSAHFAVVGDGPHLAELKSRFPEVTFTGYLRGDSLWAAYASSEVFVFPSTTDTFGNVVLEAHAAGLPTIVSDVGGPCELVRPGETGFVTRALDPASVAGAMEPFLTDPALQPRMSQAARAGIEARSWSYAFKRFWDETL
ncbi:MAG: glycosyltransferase [Verrucomicrobiae bacterium]|nr:glycosyltransferase [Verrucomicrobiae bacterium]